MWIIELGVIQLVGNLLSQLEWERKKAGDKQRTLPETCSGQTHHVALLDSREKDGELLVNVEGCMRLREVREMYEGICDRKPCALVYGPNFYS